MNSKCRGEGDFKDDETEMAIDDWSEVKWSEVKWG